MTNGERTGRTEPIEFWVQLSERLEKSGDYLGACDNALLGLEQHSGSRDLQYRAILNLSRIGANKRAKQLWAHYGLSPDLGDGPGAPDLEQNIAALGARLDREDAYSGELTERTAKLKKAADNYESVYRHTTSSFLGINAAVLHELGGNTARAKEIASRIAADWSRAKPRSQEEAYQLAADRAAAKLLLDDLEGTASAIEGPLRCRQARRPLHRRVNRSSKSAITRGWTTR